MTTIDVMIDSPVVEVDVSPPGLSVDMAAPVLRTLTSESLPGGGSPGDILVKQSIADFDAAWVAPANAVESDNTLPITSAAVYTTVGNINALLATI